MADQLEPMRTSVSVHLLALLAGCSAGFFLLVSVFNLSAEGVLAKESAEAETWYQMYQKTLDVLANVNTVVVAKINRIKRLTKEFGDRGTADRVTVCRTALNPEDQVQTLVACVHEFFWQNIAGLKLRVALFVPHANYLVVKASTDGDAHNVVTSPNRENKHFFSLESDPRCIAVRAFKYRVPIILPDCSKDEHFTYFSEIQKNQIKSMVACPLCHGERQDLGVLVVDASEDEFFEANPVFETMLKLLGEQIALRLSLEECVSNLFTTFENAETKERT